MRLTLALVPTLTLIVIEIYAGTFDGWGAWSTAPLLLVPAILGLAIGSAIFIELCSRWRNRQNSQSAVIRLALALLPVFWLLVRKQVL